MVKRRKAMMYEEFCEGTGARVDWDCYGRIEDVYVAFERFDSKQAIYDFYKAHGMEGIEVLYEELRVFNQHQERSEQLQRELNVVIGMMNNRAMLCGIRAA
jgi:hypothetical protein